MPESPQARYSLTKGFDANKDSWVARILTFLTAPIMIFLVAIAGIRINVVPDEDWEIPLDAPNLPLPFKPQAARYGPPTDAFDQRYDAPGQKRNKARVRDASDPYGDDRPMPPKNGATTREASDAALGDVDTESSLRYDDHARLRMQARREGLVAKTALHVDAEDKPESASAAYTAWRNGKIKTHLADTIDTHATDHSTILANPMHAEKALAYDIANGHCHILDKDLHKLRIAADWRFSEGLEKDDPNKVYEEYFLHGKFNKQAVLDWANEAKSSGRMPDKIVDVREHQKRRQDARSNRGNNA